MKGIGIRHLGLSIWPFAIISLGELLGAVLIMRMSTLSRTPVEVLTQAFVAIVVGLAVAAVCVVLARRG